MSSNPAAGRRAPYLPGPDFSTLRTPVSRQPKRDWFRVHRSGVPAIDFGIRPHHRFSHPDSSFSLLYVGMSISTCLWEYFGDDVFRGKQVISKRKWDRCSLSKIKVPPLQVCSMDEPKTREAMRVDAASLLAPELSIPQAWALAIQGHPSDFEAIKYLSRFSGEPCLALLGRPRIKAQVEETPLGSLNDLDEAVQWLTERGAALL